MQIVITLSEEDYNLLVNVNDDKLPSMNARRHLHEQLKAGIVLPKGHGRLIDADKLEDYIKEDADEWDEYALAYVKNASTIIEANKDGE